MNINKKIIFVIPKYKVGGAENVMITLANELSQYDIKIFFVILSQSKKIKLNRKINLINLDSKRVINSIFKLNKLINTIKPEICFSTISHTNIALFLASKFSKHKCKIFLRESNNIFESIKNKNFLYKMIFMKLLRFSYQNSILLSPSKHLSNEIKKKFCIKKKVFNLPNPIILKKITKNKKKIYDFISIASLTDQKDHLTLLKAFKIALKTNKKLKLVIIGEGVLKLRILEFIKENKLKNNVLLLNYKKNFLEYLNKSKLFILSSQYEGYPNVLLDAANNLLPIISTNCKYGPSEILFNGKYGKLFETGNYFKLSKLMLLNHKIIKKIPKKYLKMNDLKIIGKKYYDLFFNKNF